MVQVGPANDPEFDPDRLTWAQVAEGFLQPAPPVVLPLRSLTFRHDERSVSLADELG